MVTMQKTDKNGATYQAKALLISFSQFLYKISIGNHILEPHFIYLEDAGNIHIFQF